MSNTEQPPYPYDQPHQEEPKKEETPPDPKDPYQLGATAIGLPAHVTALIACIPPLVFSFVLLLVESKNRFVRFYAVQALSLGILWLATYIFLWFLAFPYLFQFLYPLHFLLNLAYIAGCVLLMVHAYQGQWYRLPILGDISARLAKLDL